MGVFLPAFTGIVSRLAQLAADHLTRLIRFHGGPMRRLPELTGRRICGLMPFFRRLARAAAVQRYQTSNEYQQKT